MRKHDSCTDLHSGEPVLNLLIELFVLGGLQVFASLRINGAVIVNLSLCDCVCVCVCACVCVRVRVCLPLSLRV